MAKKKKANKKTNTGLRRLVGGRNRKLLAGTYKKIQGRNKRLKRKLKKRAKKGKG